MFHCIYFTCINETNTPGKSLSSPLATHPHPEKASKRVPFPAHGVVDVFWKKGCFFSTNRHKSQIAGALFNSTQSNYYQVRLKYWMQEMNIFMKILELFCSLAFLFALIWTSIHNYAVQ